MDFQNTFTHILRYCKLENGNKIYTENVNKGHKSRLESFDSNIEGKYHLFHFPLLKLRQQVTSVCYSNC